VNFSIHSIRDVGTKANILVPMHHVRVTIHVIRQCQLQAILMLVNAVMQVSIQSSPTMQPEVNAMRPPLQAAVGKDLPWLKDPNLSAWAGIRLANKSAVAVSRELQRYRKSVRLMIYSLIYNTIPTTGSYN
tara:strand:+ start:213 stop:605 length:393 start_codon:yes stop_codon:yes gene_type:complete